VREPIETLPFTLLASLFSVLVYVQIRDDEQRTRERNVNKNEHELRSENWEE